jgi:dimethylaniline monooxygenase (N-oxide forming)
VNGIDAVVMATGYDARLPFMEPGIVSDVDGYIDDLYLFTFSPRLKHQTLAVTGFVDPDLSVWPIAELQARAATRVFKVWKKTVSTMCLLGL